jgi:hypothetical protein
MGGRELDQRRLLRRRATRPPGPVQTGGQIGNAYFAYGTAPARQPVAVSFDGRLHRIPSATMESGPSSRSAPTPTVMDTPHQRPDKEPSGSIQPFGMGRALAAGPATVAFGSPVLLHAVLPGAGSTGWPSG